MELPLLIILLSLAHASLAHLKSNAFPGYGFRWYDPVCGYACNNAIASATLECTVMDHSHGHSHAMGATSPACRAGDTPFLTTLAWCMNAMCDPVKVPTWQREKFWATKVTGDPAVVPKWDYSRALEDVGEKPTIEFNASSTDTLNQTVVLGMADYETQSRFMVKFDYLEMLQAKYMYASPECL